jgi:hypothetical protein
MSGSSAVKTLPEMQRVNESLEVIEYIPHDPEKLCELLKEYCNKLREHSIPRTDAQKIYVSKNQNVENASSLYRFILNEIVKVASPINANSMGLPASLSLEFNMRLVEAKALLGYFDWGWEQNL